MNGKTWLAMVAALMLLGSCGRSKSDAITAEGFGARSDGDKLWGVVDAKGRYVVRNVFSNPPTAMTDGMFFVADDDGQYVAYSSSQPATPAKASPFEQVTSFFKGRAFMTRRGTSIFIVDRDCSVVTLLPDTVWEVRLAGTRTTGFAYRDQLGRWGLIDGDGNVLEAAECQSYEDFCLNHVDMFIKHPDPGKSLATRFGDIVTVNPLDPVNERMYAAKTSSGWELVNGAGEAIGSTRWSEYAFPIDYGEEFVARLTTGDYGLYTTRDGRASKVGDLAFKAVSGEMFTSVKSGKMYPQTGCNEICDFLVSINLSEPDTVTKVIPVTTDAAYYKLTEVTVTNLNADVFIAKSTVNPSQRLMAVVKIVPEGRITGQDDYPRMLRNLMYGMEKNIELRTGWDRVGGESHALRYGDNERFIYILPYKDYLVAVVSLDRLDYQVLMGGALKKVIEN